MAKKSLSKNNFYKFKKILVAGGSGMIGIELVKRLLDAGAEVGVVSLDSKKKVEKVLGKKVKFTRADLTSLRNCLKATAGCDFVFNLIGIKGSVGIGEKKVASYFVPMLRYQTNLMDAAFKNKVKRFLFVSSICAYPQSNIAKEEDTVWNGMPRQNDRIPGIAKRVGELQGEAYLKEYGWDAVRVVRPANVYGPFDDFNPATAQVIPALIARVVGGENPLKVWGDGSARRDFIYVEDVADGILTAIEKAPACFAVNLGSGKAVSIKEIVKVIVNNASKKPKIEWDSSKPAGDPMRLLSTKRAKKYLRFKPKYTLEAGIKKTMDWYKEYYKLSSLRSRNFSKLSSLRSRNFSKL